MGMIISNSKTEIRTPEQIIEGGFNTVREKLIQINELILSIKNAREEPMVQPKNFSGCIRNRDERKKLVKTLSLNLQGIAKENIKVMETLNRDCSKTISEFFLKNQKQIYLITQQQALQIASIAKTAKLSIDYFKMLAEIDSYRIREERCFKLFPLLAAGACGLGVTVSALMGISLIVGVSLPVTWFIFVEKNRFNAEVRKLAHELSELTLVPISSPV